MDTPVGVPTHLCKPHEQNSKHTQRYTSTQHVDDKQQLSGPASGADVARPGGRRLLDSSYSSYSSYSYSY